MHFFFFGLAEKKEESKADAVLCSDTNPVCVCVCVRVCVCSPPAIPSCAPSSGVIASFASFTISQLLENALGEGILMPVPQFLDGDGAGRSSNRKAGGH